VQPAFICEAPNKARRADTKRFKIIIEKHPDGYVAYPVGIKGVVVGQGNTYEEALSDVQSALKFHLDTFGGDMTPDPDRFAL
jgi:predicted RNase H-like HicB family nuclease